MISFSEILQIIKGEHPNTSEEEAEEAAEDVMDNLKDAAQEVESEDVAEDLQDSERRDFSLLEDTRTYGVMVLSQGDEHTCSSCLDHDGTVYKLDEAKEKEPIPHSDCQNDECRCSYIPVPDEDAYRKNKQEEPDLSDLRD